MFVGFPRRILVVVVVGRCPGPTSTAQPPASPAGHPRRSSPGDARLLSVGRRPHDRTRDAPALAAGAADAAESAADVLVDETERRGHDRTEVGDGEQRQWNSENRVQYRDHLAPARLRRYVTVTYSVYQTASSSSYIRR